MTKLLIATATAIAMAGVVATGLSAQAKPGNAMCAAGFYYSVEQPDWSKAGVPCWKPWAQNPMLKYRATHNGLS